MSMIAIEQHEVVIDWNGHFAHSTYLAKRPFARVHRIIFELASRELPEGFDEGWPYMCQVTVEFPGVVLIHVNRGIDEFIEPLPEDAD